MASTFWNIRVFKSFGSRDLSRAWVNNYELTTPSPVGPLDLQPAANAIVAAEKTIHLNNVQFLQVTISTWDREPTRYDPTAFVTITQSGVGARALGTDDMLDLNVCFVLQFTVTTGRQGRRFYRGVLVEPDVSANTSGTFQLVSGSALADAGAGMANFRTALAPVLPSGNAGATLALFGKGITVPTTTRTVTAVHTGGIVAQKRNHKYYDRHAFG